MTCRSVEASLSAYIDGELSPEETSAVRSHLAECPDCRREEREIRSLKSLLGGMSRPEPAPDFEARLQQSVHGFRKRRDDRGWAGSTIVAAGIAMACMAITLEVLSSRGSSAPTPSAPHDIAFEAHRDHVWNLSADPTSGATMFASYGR